MTLQIQNSNSSIKITQNGGSWYIPKPYLVKFIPTVVQPVGGIREGIITIQYNQGDETKEFDFTWTDCTSPIRTSIQLLVNVIESYNHTGNPIENVNATIVAPSMGNNPYYLESIPVGITPDQPAIPVKGNILVSSLTLTRPSDTNAYIAKDTVSNSTSAPVVLTFEIIVNIEGASGYITKARLITNQSTNTAKFRLHLYRTSPTAINDNSPFTFLAADTTGRIGIIDFPACQTEGSGSNAAYSMFTIGTLNNASTQSPQGALPFISSSTSIFGILETLDAFIPISAQTFFIELTADVNG
jgi:hypothetical protein